MGLVRLVGKDDLGLRVHRNAIDDDAKRIDHHAVRVDDHRIDDGAPLGESARGNRVEGNHLRRSGIHMLDRDAKLFLHHAVDAPDDDGRHLQGRSGRSRNLLRANEVDDASEHGFARGNSGDGITRDNVLERNEARGSGVADP